MLLLIKYTLLYGIVLMLVALGGMFSEHSGVINIALEGIMVVGGLAGVLVTASLPTTMAPALIVLAAVVAAAVCGMLYSLLLAFASINLKADQTIGGTALNMLATAIAMILAKNFNGSTSAKISYTNKPFLFSIGGLELSILSRWALCCWLSATLLCIRPALACACAPAASTPRQRIPLVSTSTACAMPVC